MFYFVQCYHQSINDVIYNQVNSSINTFAYNSVDYETHLAANLLTEALMLRDHVYCFSNGFSLRTKRYCKLYLCRLITLIYSRTFI